jgi:hypothetical protein
MGARLNVICSSKALKREGMKSPDDEIAQYSFPRRRDVLLRTYRARSGMPRGALSTFVADALGIEDDAERRRLAQVIVARGSAVRDWCAGRLPGRQHFPRPRHSRCVQELLRNDAISVRLHQRAEPSGATGS